MKYLPLRHPDPKGKRPVRNPDVARLQELVLPIDSAVCGLLALIYLFSTPMDLSVGVPSSAYLLPGGKSCPPLLDKHRLTSQQC